PGILGVAPYVGGDATAPGFAEPIRLASNENPLGASPRAREAYAAAADELHRYPDGSADELRRAIGERHGLDPARIVCGNGSDELITLLIRAYAGPGDEVLYSAHGFLMYAIAARTAGATPVAVPERDLTADLEGLTGRAGLRTRVVCLANPNNPTGSCLSGAELERLVEGLPDHVLLLLDAAYAEYVLRNDYEDGAKLVEASPRVVMTRTFSKIHGLAGLRLGWAYASAEVADVLNRMRGPFNVTAPALAAGVAAIEDRDHPARSRDHNARWLEWFREQTAALGLDPRPSAGNFVLLRFPGQNGQSATTALAWLKDRGILVRGMTAYGLPDCLRVTIGTEAETRAVVAALAEFVG
ncbi:MAG: histidinol-phosphate transaminase, partial [Kiloniellales bacterium]|nr:histidinol-phosphate transaminase [Kiloniellales bacterium]